MIRLEQRMKIMFDEIDDWLEDRYGRDYPLHPNRPRRGRTSNREMDGLFNIGADFTPGYGSRLGRGYIVRVRMSTLSQIPEQIRKKILDDVEQQVSLKLPENFPGRGLNVSKDGNLLKITGDFSLGTVK